MSAGDRPGQGNVAMSATEAPLEGNAGMRADDTSATRLVLRGRKVVGGVAEGEALVTRDTISGWGGVNAMEGTIIEARHELRGRSFAGKILVFPGAKGSSGWSVAFHTARLAGKAPKALVFNEMTTKVALGAVVMRVPSVTDLDRDPLEVIETGDWVRVDGDAGTVEVVKRAARSAVGRPAR
jgi:predicted aconitase with swiveling domain